MSYKVTLSNEELIERCDKWIVDLCKDRKNWTLSVPVQINRDPDILFTELIKRFKEALHPSESAGVKGAVWVKASKMTIEYGKTYYVKWVKGSENLMGTGWFQESDGTFFWYIEGYIPCAIGNREHLLILDESPTASGDGKEPQAFEAMHNQEVFFRLENNDDGFWLSVIDRKVYPRVWADNFKDQGTEVLAETVDNLINSTVLAEKDWVARFFGETIQECLDQYNIFKSQNK